MKNRPKRKKCHDIIGRLNPSFFGQKLKSYHPYKNRYLKLSNTTGKSQK